MRKGEIVGIAGLDGSGRTETLENIFGIATRKDGVIKLDGKVVKTVTPENLLKMDLHFLQRRDVQQVSSEF